MNSARKIALVFVLVFVLVGCSGSIGMPGTGIATLSWGAPTTNTDGSMLTDLAGYRIHYGVTRDNLSTIIEVGNSTSYQINNLIAGDTYYFAVTAYTTTGVESAYSNEVSKRIP